MWRDFLSLERFRSSGKRAGRSAHYRQGAFLRKPLVAAGRGGLERIPQKLTDFCDQNSLELFDVARFLIARTIPFERKAR
jgi:hypothetical protein